MQDAFANSSTYKLPGEAFVPLPAVESLGLDPTGIELLQGLAAVMRGEKARPLSEAAANHAKRHMVFQLFCQTSTEAKFYRRLCAANFAQQRSVVRELAELFQARELQFAVVKGISIVDSSGCDQGTRYSQDVDLLVQKHDRVKALNLLHAAGFSLTKSLNSQLVLWSQLPPWKNQHQDSEGLCLQRRHSFVDLHLVETFPIDCREISSFLGDGTELRYLTLSRPQLLLYLVNHARKHLWGRIKYLLDIELLYSSLNEKERFEVLASSKKRQSETALHCSLILCSMVFGSSWVSTSDYSPQSMKVATRALRGLFTEHQGISGKGLNFVSTFQAEDRISGGLRSVLQRAFVPTAADFSWCRVPFALRHSYFLLRLLRAGRLFTSDSLNKLIIRRDKHPR